MNTTSSRKLAAILFADIAGYTAMMQKNESSAMEVLETYQSSIQKLVEQYGGEIIKNYGDGSIFLFSSASGAITCALDIPLVLQGRAPSRLGLYLGDIICGEGDL